MIHFKPETPLPKPIVIHPTWEQGEEPEVRIWDADEEEDAAKAKAEEDDNMGLLLL